MVWQAKFLEPEASDSAPKTKVRCARFKGSKPREESIQDAPAVVEECTASIDASCDSTACTDWLPTTPINSPRDSCDDLPVASETTVDSLEGYNSPDSSPLARAGSHEIELPIAPLATFGSLQGWESPCRSPRSRHDDSSDVLQSGSATYDDTSSDLLQSGDTSCEATCWNASEDSVGTVGMTPVCNSHTMYPQGQQKQVSWRPKAKQTTITPSLREYAMEHPLSALQIALALRRSLHEPSSSSSTSANQLPMTMHDRQQVPSMAPAMPHPQPQLTCPEPQQQPSPPQLSRETFPFEQSVSQPQFSGSLEEQAPGARAVGQKLLYMLQPGREVLHSLQGRGQHTLSWMEQSNGYAAEVRGTPIRVSDLFTAKPGPQDGEDHSDCSTVDTASVGGHPQDHVSSWSNSQWDSTTAQSSFSLAALGSVEYPSFGSRGHLDGTCRPCAFFYSKSGCVDDVACMYCHLCNQGEKKRRQRVKREAERPEQNPVLSNQRVATRWQN